VRSVLVVVSDCAQEVSDVVIVQSISNMPPFSFGDDESQLSEDPQLVGDSA